MSAGEFAAEGETLIDRARVLAAAGLLLEVRAGGRLLRELPLSVRPASEAEAYAVQDEVMRVLGPSRVFKAGAKGGIGPRTLAPVPAALVSASPARFALAQFGGCILEVEIAYRLGRDLPARAQPYSDDEVREAIDAIVPAIEIADSRFLDYRDVDRFSQLADNQNCGAFVHAAPVADWRGIDPRELVARLSADGKEIAHTRGGHRMGDPFALLPWFVNRQSARGRDVPAGTVVTTGSFTGSIRWQQPAAVTAVLEGVGRVELVLE